MQLNVETCVDAQGRVTPFNRLRHSRVDGLCVGATRLTKSDDFTAVHGSDIYLFILSPYAMKGGTADSAASALRSKSGRIVIGDARTRSARRTPIVARRLRSLVWSRPSPQPERVRNGIDVDPAHHDASSSCLCSSR